MKLLTKTAPKTVSSLPEITVPDSWNKLSRRQLLFLSLLFGKALEQYHFKVIALNKLSGIKITGKYYIHETNQRYCFQVKHQRRRFFVTAGLYKELLKSIAFITSPSTLTLQLIPRFWFGRWFYGPSDSLYNISYNELVHAQLAYTNFENTKDPAHLNHLLAVLYRRKKKSIRKSDPNWDGDMRENFSAYTYQRRARWFRFVPFKLKYTVFIFYSGSLSQMADEHPLCFKAPTRVSSKPKKENPAKALIDLVPVITKGDPTKNNELYKTPAWDVFDAYERMREEFEATKK